MSGTPLFGAGSSANKKKAPQSCQCLGLFWLQRVEAALRDPVGRGTWGLWLAGSHVWLWSEWLPCGSGGSLVVLVPGDGPRWQGATGIAVGRAIKRAVFLVKCLFSC